MNLSIDDRVEERIFDLAVYLLESWKTKSKEQDKKEKKKIPEYQRTVGQLQRV